MMNLKPLEVLRRYPAHDSTLYGLMASRAARQGDAPFLLFEGHTLSWAGFKDRVDATTRLLDRHGIQKGDRIGLMMSNSMDYIVILFATAAMGAILVPINPDLTAAEAGYIVGHARPALVFCTPQTQRTLQDAHVPEAAHQLVVLAAQTLGPHLSELPTDAPTQIPHSEARDTTLIIYTSGTTSKPKGVMHSQFNMAMVGEYFVERLHLQPDDRLLCVLPFFHINALFYSLMGTVAAGASLVIAPRFSASGFWRLAAESRATEVNIIATVGRILMRRPASEFVPGHHIRKLYGAPIPNDVHTNFRTRFGIPVLIEGYGLTEAPAICSNPYDGPRKIGSIGITTNHPNPDQPSAKMRIVNDEDRDLPDGHIGELLVKSPILMQGYYQDPEATRQAFSEGWFRTGDLVRRDGDGFYTFIARKKDIIRRRGENISGAEIDDAVAGHPDVQVAAAIPVASELGEDDILVAVVKKPDTKLSEQELHCWCRSRLNPIKVPRYIVFVDSFPYTPSHRVAKYQLRHDRTLLQRAVEYGGWR